MYETLEFELTPCDEQCVQVGSEFYTDVYRHEAIATRQMIYKKYPSLEGLIRIKINPHEFGTYHTLELKFKIDSEIEEIAYDLDSNFPSKWDEEAKAYLREKLPKGYLSTLDWE